MILLANLINVLLHVAHIHKDGIILYFLELIKILIICMIQFPSVMFLYDTYIWIPVVRQSFNVLCLMRYVEELFTMLQQESNKITIIKYNFYGFQFNKINNLSKIKLFNYKANVFGYLKASHFNFSIAPFTLILCSSLIHQIINSCVDAWKLHSPCLGNTIYVLLRNLHYKATVIGNIIDWFDPYFIDQITSNQLLRVFRYQNMEDKFYNQSFKIPIHNIYVKFI